MYERWEWSEEVWCPSSMYEMGEERGGVEPIVDV